MCGIVGVVDRSGVPRELPLSSMRDSAMHRGPDGVGEWWSPCGRAAFAHCRLAVIDLSAESSQPLSSHDGAYTIVFNGEIYNYRELRQQLEAKGHRFRTHGDTEVFVESYRAWGRACLERLSGMFAFALFDAKAGAVLLARDRAGEKPLYFRWEGERLLFASEIKSLLGMPGAPRAVDLDAFNHYLAYGYTPPDQAMLAGYRKLPQAHSLWVELGRARQEEAEYWSLPEEGSLGQLSEADAERAVEESLIHATRKQLVADVPLGILLSGGLDSSLITAIAATHGSGVVNTFNVSFPGAGLADESAHARLIARHFGTHHYEIPLSEPPRDILDRLAQQFDDPIADHAIVPTSMLAEVVRRHCTVALSGDGGDELFGGYRHYNWIQWSSSARAVLPARVRNRIASAAHGLAPGVRARSQLMGLGGDIEHGVAHINLLFDSALRARLAPALGDMPAARLTRPEALKRRTTRGGQTPVGKATRSDFRSTLVDAYLVKTDRASMLHSLELRAPFLDRELIELAFGRIPSQLRATARGRKVLLRHLAKRLLPAEFDRQRKQGFTMPLGRLFSGAWRAHVDRILHAASPEIFDRRAIAKLWEHPRRRNANATRMFAILMFELWRSAYGATLE